MELNNNVTIQLTNVENNETFTFSVIIVKGYISGDSSCGIEDQISVNYLDPGGDVSKESLFKLMNKKFSVLLRLKPGNNEFLFKYKTAEMRQTFRHTIPSVKFVVSPLFIVCEGEEIKYHSIKNIKNKIIVGCNLIQSLIAEILYDYGFGRKTFALEQEDSNGNSGCVIFYSKLNLKTANTMNSEELWEHFGREIMTSEYGYKHRKFLSFLSSGEGKTSQNLAIGGGGLALCSAEYIKTWPNSIDDINNCFNNEITNDFSRTNHMNYLYRNHLSASLGAVCHELCHTFDLGHTMNGIMGRDFDRIGIIFSPERCTLQQATKKLQNFNCTQSKKDSLIVHEGISHRKLRINYSINCDISLRSTSINTFSESCSSNINRTACEDETTINHIVPPVLFLSVGCASLLAYHKWINQCSSSKNVNVNVETDACSALHYDVVRNIVTSTFGLILIQLRNHDGYITKSWEFAAKKLKTLFLVPICESRKADFIVIQDLKGNLLKKDVEHFFKKNV